VNGSVNSALENAPAVTWPPLCLPPAPTGLAQSRRSGHTYRRKRPVSGVAAHGVRRASSQYSSTRHSSAHLCNAAILLSVRNSGFIWRRVIHLANQKWPLLRLSSIGSLYPKCGRLAQKIEFWVRSSRRQTLGFRFGLAIVSCQTIPLTQKECFEFWDIEVRRIIFR
jgi:hypothetical protein